MRASRVLRRLPASAKDAAVVMLNHRGLRRSVLRGHLFDLLRFVTPSVAVEKDGVFFHVPTADRYLSRHTFVHGEYELDILSDALDLLGRQNNGFNVLAGRTFIDIGANIGTTIIPALKIFGAGRGIAFEPGPDNFRVLRCNIAANDLIDRVDAYQLALSDSNTTTHLELSSYNWGDHRLRASTDELDRVSVPVRSVRFDDIVAEMHIDLDSIGLVWMDTQGFEGHILAGAQTLLRQSIPAVCEYWPFGLRRSGGLDQFHSLVSTHYRRVIDLRASRLEGHGVELSAQDVGAIESRYSGVAYTDLLLT